MATMTKEENFNYIHDNLGMVTVCDQMIEECSEMIQAVCKYKRNLEGINPTRMSTSDIQMNLVEELSDILLTAKIMGIEEDQDTQHWKLARWTASIDARKALKEKQE